MKIFNFIVISFVVSSSIAKAQTKPQLSAIDTLGYNLSVIYKVKDIAATTNMSQDRQVILANFFKREEMAVSIGVNNGISSGELQQLKNQFIAQFQALLTPQELAVYKLKRKDSEYVKIPGSFQ